MSLETMKNGFHKCGICPFSPEAIDWSKLIDDDDLVSATSSSTTVRPCASAPVISETDQPSTSVTARIHKHPFVEHKIVPLRLVDVLVIPHLTETKKPNTRIATVGRVITTDEHRKMVKDKLEAAKKTAAEKLVRRQERERKKEEKEEKKRRPKKEDTKRRPTKQEKVIPPTSRSSKRLQNVPRKDFARLVANRSPLTSDEDEASFFCAKCEDEEPPGDSDPINWIQCERCDEWYHVECEDPENPDDIDYICKQCLGH